MNIVFLLIKKLIIAQFLPLTYLPINSQTEKSELADDRWLSTMPF